MKLFRGLFHGFQCIQHIHVLQSAVDDCAEDCGNHGNQHKRDQKCSCGEGRVKHDLIRRHHSDDVLIEPVTGEESHQDAQQCEDDRFPVDIEGNLLVVESQHLDGGEFPDAFGYVDVCQIVQNDHAEQNSDHDQNPHDLVQGFDNDVDLAYHGGVLDNAGDAAQFHERCRHFVCVFRRAVTQPDQIGIRREILSGELLIICRADEQEVSGVHFGYSGDLHFLGIAGRILQCDGVSCGNIQQLAEPFADDNAVVCQCNGLSALSLIQGDVRGEVVGVFRAEQLDGLAVLGFSGGDGIFLVVNGCIAFHHILVRQLFVDRLLFLGIQVVVFGGNQIIPDDLVELPVVDAGDGVLYAESGEEDGHRAADTENGHQHPLFVAEDVSCCHLVGKAHAVPDGRDAFQENLGAVCRRFRL